MGVASLMLRTSKPAVERARTADSRPEPGPLIRTSTVRMPLSPALLAAVMAACWAAKGVPLRDPRKPSEPALDQEMVLPSWSAIVTMVLLNVAWMCTMPEWTTRFSFFLKVFFFAFAAGLACGAFAIILCLGRRFLLIGNGAAARAFAGTRVGISPLAAHRETAAVAHAAVRSHLDVALDVHRDLFAQIAFHGAFFFEDGTDAIDLVFRQVADLFVELDPRAMEQGTGPAAANAVDVSQTNFGSLFGRQIDAR